MGSTVCVHATTHAARAQCVCVLSAASKCVCVKCWTGTEATEVETLTQNNVAGFSLASERGNEN